jgi:RNA polymerase sigma-B factor
LNADQGARTSRGSGVGARDERLVGNGRAASPSVRSRRSEGVRWCETEALLSRWQEDRDQAAREELVARFLPLARKLAGHYRAYPELIEDLVQVASLGLLGAIDRFDPARGVPFTAFAVPTILGELKHYYRNTGWSVHVPPGAQELAMRVDRAAREIASHSGHRARIGELAERLEITTEDVVAGIATATAHYSISLDTSAFAGDIDEDDALAGSIGTDDGNYEVVETVLSVSAAVTRLPSLERQAVRLRLDFEMKQTEIGLRLNCSQQQVSRLLRRAAARLEVLIDPPLGGMNPPPAEVRSKPARSLRRAPPRRH